ncbi:MAG TPA: class I SAM-dependent methyltransferase [Marmoricola sp.]|nr:class I SAM-dependent methyltransferase [Marmoricola sp.]
MSIAGGNPEEHLLARWRMEQSRPIAGWDFSLLQGRMGEDEPPWDFDAICRQELERAERVLDMGTGGGEQLLTFADVLPADTVATEGWPPNLPVARDALGEHGIPVEMYDAESTDPAGRRMPFEDDRFDLILNRHEAFIAEDVARVLAPGGVFLTQQVAGDDAHELHDLFGGHASYPAHLKDELLRQAHSAGLDVHEAAEWTGTYRFHDVAALVAYLHLVPWDAPEDFTVDHYADQLLALHRDHQGIDITLTKRRFWFRAQLR